MTACSFDDTLFIRSSNRATEEPAAINFSSRLIYESTRKASSSRVDDYEAVTERGLTVERAAALAASSRFPVGEVARGRRRILRERAPFPIGNSESGDPQFRRCEEHLVIHALWIIARLTGNVIRHGGETRAARHWKNNETGFTAVLESIERIPSMDLQTRDYDPAVVLGIFLRCCISFSKCFFLSPRRDFISYRSATFAEHPASRGRTTSRIEGKTAKFPKFPKFRRLQPVARECLGLMR